MNFGDSRRAGQRVCSVWILLSVCLLVMALSADALAASGSTRLTIHLDQSVIDAIARWKGEAVQPPVALPLSEASGVLQRLLPAARVGLLTTQHPEAVEPIIRQLREDSVLVFEGRAEQAGDSGAVCLSAPAAGGRLTVHSI